MASQADVAQLLQASGVSVFGLQVSDEGETTIVRGQVSSDADKATAEATIRSAVGDRVTSYLEVQQGLADAPSPPQGRRYVAKPGDTLRKIAERFYGDEMKWHGIRDANRATLPDPDRLPAGTELLIPDDPGGPGA